MNYSKLHGTQETSFSLGFKFAFDASAVSVPYSFKLPSAPGSTGQVLTVGTGNQLIWTTGGGGGGGDSTVPYYIQFGDTYTVNSYKQALFSIPITVEGELTVDGILIEV